MDTRRKRKPAASGVVDLDGATNPSPQPKSKKTKLRRKTTATGSPSGSAPARASTPSAASTSSTPPQVATAPSPKRPFANATVAPLAKPVVAPKPALTIQDFDDLQGTPPPQGYRSEFFTTEEFETATPRREVNKQAESIATLALIQSGQPHLSEYALKRASVINAELEPVEGRVTVQVKMSSDFKITIPVPIVELVRVPRAQMFTTKEQERKFFSKIATRIGRQEAWPSQPALHQPLLPLSRTPTKALRLIQHAKRWVAAVLVEQHHDEMHFRDITNSYSIKKDVNNIIQTDYQARLAISTVDLIGPTTEGGAPPPQEIPQADAVYTFHAFVKTKVDAYGKRYSIPATHTSGSFTGGGSWNPDDWVEPFSGEPIRSMYYENDLPRPITDDVFPGTEQRRVPPPVAPTLVTETVTPQLDSDQSDPEFEDDAGGEHKAYGWGRGFGQTQPDSDGEDHPGSPPSPGSPAGSPPSDQPGEKGSPIKIPDGGTLTEDNYEQLFGLPPERPPAPPFEVTDPRLKRQLEQQQTQ